MARFNGRQLNGVSNETKNAKVLAIKFFLGTEIVLLLISGEQSHLCKQRVRYISKCTGSSVISMG